VRMVGRRGDGLLGSSLAGTGLREENTRCDV